MKKSQTTSQANSNTDRRTLYMAIELSSKIWKIAFSDGLKRNPRIVNVPAGDVGATMAEVAKAKKAFGMAPEAETVSCCEAGRDGFWPHRMLTENGIRNLVLDPASIEVSRHRRRKKTDRLDAGKMVLVLIRYEMGDEWACRVVRVPSVEDEDERQPHREIEALKKERTRHRNRIYAEFACHGVKARLTVKTLRNLQAIRDWRGERLPERTQRRIEREAGRLDLVERQIREIDRQMQEALKRCDNRKSEMVLLLSSLSGIGWRSAWLFVYEFFGWRKFKNRKEVGALAGLTGTPYNSGSMEREQGISKAGNRRVRGLIVELAWLWLRFQPDSKLSKWFQEKWGGGGRRVKKVGIVALARRLLVALWRMAEFGEIPEGAKSA